MEYLKEKLGSLNKAAGANKTGITVFVVCFLLALVLQAFGLLPHRLR